MEQNNLDNLTILQKADMIKIRAVEIMKNNKTISIKKAYDLAAKELFQNNKVSY